MFKKKKTQNEINMTYFFGGTAVGMAAGLLFKTLLSHVLDENTVKSDINVLSNKNGNKYSQDDNLHQVHIKRNAYNCHTHSKSASRYEKKNYRNQGEPFAQFHKNFECNMNNIDMNHMHNKDVKKIYCDYKKHTLYNISIEDNAKCNLPIETSEYADELQKYNSYQHLSESMEIKPDDNESTKNGNSITDSNIKIINSNNDMHTLKQVKSAYGSELIDTINYLSIDLCENINTNTNMKLNKNTNISMTDILPENVDNLSNVDTYNDNIHFNITEILNLSFTEELPETDSIS